MEKKDFLSLVEKFYLKTSHLSSSYQAMQTDSAKELVQLGIATVTDIFAYKLPLNIHLMHLLAKLTWSNPIKPENVGNVEQMALDWQEWARSRGFLRP